MKKEEYCYMCNQLKSSVEHVPAKCFFPKGKEYRKNLITVPSCKMHNEDTSKDDEYVRNIICMSIGGNAIAYKQFIDKVIKSLEHCPKLKTQIFANTKQVYIEENSKLKLSFAFEIDRGRFDKVIFKMAYALYYHKFGKRWNRKLLIMTEFLRQDNLEADELGELIPELKSTLPIPSYDGQNPQVFQYQFMVFCDDKILWMKFYEGVEVFVLPDVGKKNV